MGGNVVMLYAGARTQRVRKVVSLEAFGLPRTSAEQAPARYAEWLDEVKQGSRFSTYETYEQLMRVLARRNPRGWRRSENLVADFHLESRGRARRAGAVRHATGLAP